MDISPKHRLEVRGRDEILSRVRAWASATADKLDADAQATADFTLAISEAATNVLRHAYTGEHEAHLILSARRIGERIIFRVRDFGDKFDPTSVRPAQIEGEPSIGGYGIYLMRRVMDKVRYATDHPVGTELMLIRRRSPRSADEASRALRGRSV